MHAIGREILLFGVVPTILIMFCGIGLVGGITHAEAMVPVYLAGLIYGVAAIMMFAVFSLSRIVRRVAKSLR
ncbi:hypothetical protein [Sphingomonas sp. Leaf62]|uniref:hypothetical protein n=1 Tax=Sphingomonas sp. Leaf62 TaxID=1736228 RepID=UPI0006F5F975|nr:hypothetical protein [Sphingomonas sp. Leaf62]KQN80088.1 hypothetical protein ASE91_12705 [Sphingomonas sp. Leaf62]